VVLEQAVGTPLVEAIGTDDAQGLELSDFVGLLDSLPSAVTDLPRRPAWAHRCLDYADAVAAGGRWAARARAVGDAVRAQSRTADLGPVVPTHGDFHEGQLTVRRGPAGWAITGLLDVDTVGPGHRVDDLACLIAHAVAMGEPGERVALRWESDALALADRDVLRARTAGVLLSLAAGAVHGDGPTTAGDLLDAAEARLAH
jgi:aminoglycoside phosphotransferase (APT) family kinase protein